MGPTYACLVLNIYAQQTKTKLYWKKLLSSCSAFRGGDVQIFLDENQKYFFYIFNPKVCFWGRGGLQKCFTSVNPLSEKYKYISGDNI